MKICILCLSVFFALSCSLFQKKLTRDDPLVLFYKTDPLPETVASLKLTERARENIKDKKYSKALALLNQSLEIDPDNAFSYYFLGLLYHEKNEPKRSNGILERAKLLFREMPFWLSACYELSSQNWLKLGYGHQAQEDALKAEALVKH
ncbi:MAG: tetratricopeptide repeat protein [Deltaproteobacteria bacterium]|nr:tetratricopeptide repeat protein [Deltaproteobacteria bacterium]